MHPQYLSQTLSIILTIILTFRTPTSVFAQENEQYLNCTNIHLNCGEKFQNLGYPFWGGNRPAYCGHPQFHLNCSSGDALQITMDSVEYRVLRINQETYTLTVVRADYWNNACPDDHQNATLNSTLFRFASETQNLTLFYKCQGEDIPGLMLTQFNCTEEPGSINYYATETMRTSPDHNLFDKKCEETVVVRISNSAARNLDPISRPNLSVEIDSGFGIEWDANNSRCMECSRSQGVCGSSNNSAGEFTCYCKDGPRPLRCGSDSPSPSGNCP